MDVTYTKPLLPLRDIVIFPSIVVPLFVGREKSIKALQEAMKTDKSIILVAQKNSEIDDPSDKDLFSFGCLSKVLQLLKLPDGTVKVLVEGQKRVKIKSTSNDANFLKCDVEIAEDINVSKDLDIYAQGLVKKFEKLIVLNKKDFNENLNTIKNSKDAKIIADNIASNLNIKIFQKQEILEIRDLRKRLEKIYEIVNKETSVISVEKKIRGRVKNQMEKTQREYYLNEQLKAIQKELGEIDEGKDEIANISKAITKAKMPKIAQEKCFSELKKLKSMSPMSAEATVVRNYLDWMTELPWSEKTKINTDLNSAQKILDEDHYGLEKVKERIIEFLAVQKRIQRMKGPILCLVGPPGVGKTSLGKSVAKATGREFYQVTFQDPARTEEVFDKDPRATLTSMLVGASGDAAPEAGWNPWAKSGSGSPRPPTRSVNPLPEWLTQADLDVYTRQFERSGFRGGLNWYRNIDFNWSHTGFLTGARIFQPTLFVAGERDGVLKFMGEAYQNLEETVPHLSKKVLIPGKGHWIQQEDPKEVNRLILEFLRQL